MTKFFVILVILLVVVLVPVLLIWAVNTLFNLHIPINLDTWAAAFVLGGPFMWSAKND